MTLNVLVVSVIGRFSVTRQHTSVYNILFVNLAVTNALTSVLLWFANNLLFLLQSLPYISNTVRCLMTTAVLRLFLVLRMNVC